MASAGVAGPAGLPSAFRVSASPRAGPILRFPRPAEPLYRAGDPGLDARESRVADLLGPRHEPTLHQRPDVQVPAELLAEGVDEPVPEVARPVARAVLVEDVDLPAQLNPGLKVVPVLPVEPFDDVL